MCTGVHVVQKDIVSLQVGITGGCEPPDVGARNELQRSNWAHLSSLHKCLCITCRCSDYRGQRGHLIPLELELDIVGSSHVGAGN